MADSVDLGERAVSGGIVLCQYGSIIRWVYYCTDDACVKNCTKLIIDWAVSDEPIWIHVLDNRKNSVDTSYSIAASHAPDGLLYERADGV